MDDKLHYQKNEKQVMNLGPTSVGLVLCADRGSGVSGENGVAVTGVPDHSEAGSASGPASWVMPASKAGRFGVVNMAG